MTIFIAIIGYLAGFFGIIAFIPQTIKTIKTKNTKEISLKTYIIYNLANFFFLVLAIFSIVLPIMHPENASTNQIIIWGITIILPYTVTMIGVSCIIFIKVQNIRKFGEKANIKKSNQEIELELKPEIEEINHVIS